MGPIEPKLVLESANNTIWGQIRPFLFFFFFFFFFLSPRKRDFFRFSPIPSLPGHQKQIRHLERVPCSQTLLLDALKAIFFLKKAFFSRCRRKHWKICTELQSGPIENPRLDSKSVFRIQQLFCSAQRRGSTPNQVKIHFVPKTFGRVF